MPAVETQERPTSECGSPSGEPNGNIKYDTNADKSSSIGTDLVDVQHSNKDQNQESIMGSFNANLIICLKISYYLNEFNDYDMLLKSYYNSYYKLVFIENKVLTRYQRGIV